MDLLPNGIGIRIVRGRPVVTVRDLTLVEPVAGSGASHQGQVQRTGSGNGDGE